MFDSFVFNETIYFVPTKNGKSPTKILPINFRHKKFPKIYPQKEGKSPQKTKNRHKKQKKT